MDIVFKCGSAIILHNNAMKTNDHETLRACRLVFAPLWGAMKKHIYFKICLSDEAQTNRMHEQVKSIRKNISCSVTNTLGIFQALDARQEEINRTVLSLTNGKPTVSQWLGG